MEAWGTFVELLTHWDGDKMAAIAQTTFSNAFSWMNMYKFHLKCFFDLRLNKRLSKQSSGWWFEMLSRPLCRHRNDNRTLFLRAQLTIFQHWFWEWLGAKQAASHSLNQWWNIVQEKCQVISHIKGKFLRKNIKKITVQQKLLINLNSSSRNTASTIKWLCRGFMLCYTVCWGWVLVGFIHILQGGFTAMMPIMWLPKCWWSNLDKYSLVLLYYKMLPNSILGSIS